MLCANKRIAALYGDSFAKDFKQSSKELFPSILEKTPRIGRSIFSFNYAFTPAYIAWYKAARALGLKQRQTDELLWLINEGLILLIPKWFMQAFVKAYLNGFRKKAPIHEKRMAQDAVHPYDYLLGFRDVSAKIFEINITRCGMMTLAKDFGAMGIFPTVCRVDYLMFAHMGAGFERSKTLGDGDDLCNCRYTLGGHCSWEPEKGFIGRK